MTTPSRENLLGYVLGALDPEQEREIAAQLDRDPAVSEEIRKLRAALGRVGLDDQPDQFDPPPHLADRTCAYVATHSGGVLATPEGAIAAFDPGSERRLRWSDLVAIAAVFLAAASLFLPALSFSRFQAQIASCQNQLRLISFGLHGYSDLEPDHTFPAPEVEGNRAAAGVVAPMLVSRRLAESRNFLCSAAPVLRQETNFRVPSLAEVDRAVGPQLKNLQRTMGGDFGYNFGYVEEGRLNRPRDLRRTQFAVAGDAPSNSQPRRVSGNHLGRGQNVLFEDGHVQFYPYLPSPQVLDDPYHNREGWVAAGVDLNDAVLGASEDPPLPVSLSNLPK